MCDGCVDVRRQAQRKIDIEAERREGECLAADKEVIVHVLIAAHLHPELAEDKTPTSAQNPGVNFTIKTSMSHQN